MLTNNVPGWLKGYEFQHTSRGIFEIKPFELWHSFDSNGLLRDGYQEITKDEFDIAWNTFQIGLAHCIATKKW